MKLIYETSDGEKTGIFKPDFMCGELQVVTRNHSAYIAFDGHAIYCCSSYGDDHKAKILNGPYQTRQNIVDYFTEFFKNNPPRNSFGLLFGYTAEEIQANRERFIAEREERQRISREQDEAKRREREEQAKAKAEESLRKLYDAVRNGEPVSGPDLVKVCRTLGIELHLRTMGTLNNRVSSIKENSATCRATKSGVYNLPNSVYVAYQKAREKLIARV